MRDSIRAHLCRCVDSGIKKALIMVRSVVDDSPPGSCNVDEQTSLSL